MLYCILALGPQASYVTTHGLSFLIEVLRTECDNSLQITSTVPGTEEVLATETVTAISQMTYLKVSLFSGT